MAQIVIAGGENLILQFIKAGLVFVWLLPRIGLLVWNTATGPLSFSLPLMD